MPEECTAPSEFILQGLARGTHASSLVEESRKRFWAELVQESLDFCVLVCWTGELLDVNGDFPTLTKLVTHDIAESSSREEDCGLGNQMRTTHCGDATRY